MIIYIDENLPSNLAKALAALQEGRLDEDVEVRHVKDHFGEGITDEDWLPKAGKEKAVIITKDYSIRRTRAEMEICESFGLVVIFLKPPSKSGFKYWDLVEIVIKHWENIKECGRRERPAAYKITMRKSRPERID